MTKPDESAEITFREIFQSLPISIWVEDFTGVVEALEALNEEGVDDLAAYLRDRPGETERLVKLIRVIDINQASLGLYGAKSKDELFASLDLLFTAQALDAFRDELVAVAENRSGFTAEVESMKLGGERLDLLISVVPATPGGGWGRVLVTATDITERKRTEAQLEQSREQYKDLVVNAVDAVPDGGKIIVRSGVRRRHPRTTAAAGEGPATATQVGQVWFEVEDDGAGIPDHVRERVFEPFFTTKERGLGTGLGLSVAHGIVSRHLGSIEIDSQEHRGTRVVVLLPEEQDAQLASAVRRDSVSGLVRGSGERVLLVEDEPATRSGLCDVLESLGYEIVSVEDAEQALALPPTPAFDLLITDLMLPNLSGAALAERLLERWPDLGVIVISGYSEDRVTELVQHLKSARFMRKPFSMAELSHEIRRALSPPANHVAPVDYD